MTAGEWALLALVVGWVLLPPRLDPAIRLREWLDGRCPNRKGCAYCREHGCPRAKVRVR